MEAGANVNHGPGGVDQADDDGVGAGFQGGAGAVHGEAGTQGVHGRGSGGGQEVSERD